MDKIISYGQYRFAVSEARSRGCTLSNCFFLPDAAERKIREGRLFFQSVEDGLLILEDNKTFYRCFYYLSSGSSPSPLLLDKDAVIEFPFNSRMNNKQLRQTELIGALGFTLGRESAVMSCTPDALADLSAAAAPRVELAASDDSGQILDLLYSYFDPLYAFLPDERELLSAISDRRVFVIREDGRIGAVLHSGFDGDAAVINQVAVAADRRGKGLGRAVVDAYHKAYSDRASVFRHWVDVNNAPALGMYSRFGYKFGLRKANEYILLKKGD